jgi:hypothetical protein
VSKKKKTRENKRKNEIAEFKLKFTKISVDNAFSLWYDSQAKKK